MADKAMIPRLEYPRPQFVRPDWLCLNGDVAYESNHKSKKQRTSI